MPILAVEAFVVRCDICATYLTPLHGLPLLPDHPGPCFSTSAIAHLAAHANGWTLGRETVTCPKCSPVKPF